MGGITLRLGLHLKYRNRKFILKKRLVDGSLRMEDARTGEIYVLDKDEYEDALLAGEMEFIGQGDQTEFLKKRGVLARLADIRTLPEDLKSEMFRRYKYVRAVLRKNLRHFTKETLDPIIVETAVKLGEVVVLEGETEKADKRSHANGEEQTPERRAHEGEGWDVDSKAAVESKTAAPSWITVWRWLREYRRRNDIRDLIPGIPLRGRRGSRVAQFVDEAIDQAIEEEFLTDQRKPAYAVYRKVKDRIKAENAQRALIRARLGTSDTARQKENPALEPLVVPAPDTIYRKIGKLDPVKVAAAREGEHAAEEVFRQTGAGVHTRWILELSQQDDTPGDVFVIDDKTGLPLGRPTLNLLIDHYSRAPLGMDLGFVPPSYATVGRCLRHAILPKSYVRKEYPEIKGTWPMHGIPQLNVVDNGASYISKDFKEASQQIGSDIEWAPPGKGRHKGVAERAFRSINFGVFHVTPGTTFSNIFERRDYDPVEHAVVSLSDVRRELHRWIIEDYLRDKHSGIRGIPIAVWEKSAARFPPPLPPNATSLNILLGKKDTRTIHHYGIERDWLLYNREELGALRVAAPKGSKFTIKYDPEDLGRIYVLDPLRRVYLTVPAVAQEYAAGLTEWQHDIIRRWAKEWYGKQDVPALLEAKREIQRIVDAEWTAKRKSSTAVHMARWQGHGRDRPGEREDPDVPTQAAAAAESGLHGFSNQGSEFPPPDSATPPCPGETPQGRIIADAADPAKPHKKTRAARKRNAAEESTEPQETPEVAPDEREQPDGPEEGTEQPESFVPLAGYGGDYRLKPRN